MRTPLGAVAACQHGAFHARQALDCYSPGEVRARVRSGRWRRVVGQVYRQDYSEPTARLRLAAASLDIGRPVPACLHTAAELHGYGVLDESITHVAVAAESPCRRRAELWPHQLVLQQADIVSLRCGALATNPDRTAVDLARTLGRLDVLPVLDAALGTGRCTPASLAAELLRHLGHRGVRQARELIPLADAAAGSPQESRLRLRCHDAGLPPPSLQVPVLDRSGRACRWLDLGWEQTRIGLEYDGEGHDGAARRRADRRRHNLLTDRGWRMFYATDLDVYRNYPDLMGAIRRAMRDQGPDVADRDPETTPAP